MAVKKGHIKVLRILLTIPTLDLNVTDENGRNIALLAVECGTPNALQCLELLSRDSRVNWNIRNKNGDTPIMYTWKNKKKDMFNTLLKVPTIDKDAFLQDTFTACGVTAPECPVCYEKFPRNGKVFQCTVGHFVCERCHQRIQSCPKCRGQIIGRCHDFEQFLNAMPPSLFYLTLL